MYCIMKIEKDKTCKSKSKSKKMSSLKTKTKTRRRKNLIKGGKKRIVVPNETHFDIQDHLGEEKLDGDYEEIELDLSHCPKLEELTVQHYNYYLTSIDVSQCPHLKKLIVISHQLTELNLSYSYELEEVNCMFNRLTELDVSNCFELKYLNCSVNKIAYYVDIANNDELTTLVVSENPFINDFSYNIQSHLNLYRRFCKSFTKPYILK